MFNPGDPLLVDLGVEKADIDGVFFFRVGNEGSSSACSVLSARPADPREIGKPQVRRLGHYRGMDLQIFGRVLKVWRSDDF